jgi:lysyl-tRNA synthetase class 2
MAITGFTPRSTNIGEVRYDDEARQLEVTFLDDGGVYTYEGVPPDLYEAFASAPSAGRFFHQMIKGRYAHRRIE